MNRLGEKLWNFVGKYFISTVYTPDMGLETMVFPAEENARIVENFWRREIVGVDFANPYEEYTRHYDTVEEAKKGHKETIKILNDLIKEDAQ